MKMKHFIAALCLGFGPWLSAAKITGMVQNAETGEAIGFAQITINPGQLGTTANAAGQFTLELKPGTYTISAFALGFANGEREIVVGEKPLQLKLQLKPKSELLEAVDVTAIRASKSAPIAQSNLNKSEIEARNEGRDVPYILKDLPSAVVSSDAGTGIGYTNMRIRGSDISRINVTINGIALNDPESQGVFWVNTPDLATSTQSIQVQRGVGSSTNGAGAFGASVNLKTTGLQLEPSAGVDLSVGSFNTFKRNVTANSGLLNGHWNVQARLSEISSSGFIDRASADLQSYYLSAAYLSEKTSLQFVHFGGGERTYQAWWGIPEAKLLGDSAGIEAHIVNNGLDSAQAYNLRNSGNRTYNYYEYENQVDQYSQSHYQLHFNHQINSRWKINAALHYTKGAGYFEEFKKGENYSDYGLSNQALIQGGDTVLIENTDLVRRRWLDNDFIGATYSAQYEDEALQITYGGAYNEYLGDHFGELIWMQYAGSIPKDKRYYGSTSLKADWNNYVKAGYSFGALSVFADVQYRMVNYSSQGNDNDLSRINFNRSFNFLNPKFGLNYQLNQEQSVYAFYGRAQREPTRSDIVDAPLTQNAPVEEEMDNIEMGYRIDAARLRFVANAFYMQYVNQLVPTGELNDVGALIRINVDQSYRMGLELEGDYSLLPQLQVGGHLTLSQNRILDYNYYQQAYDENFNYLGYDTTRFSSSPIAYSPSLIFGLRANYSPIAGLDFSLIQKYVGRQYLDNTGSLEKSLDPFSVLDLRVQYSTTLLYAKEARFYLLVANALAEQYEPNGYTYGYRVGDQQITENFYYPMAGRNFMAGISLNF